MERVGEPKRVPIQEALGLTDEECEQINDIISGVDEDEVIESVLELLGTMSSRDRIHMTAGFIIARMGFVISLR